MLRGERKSIVSDMQLWDRMALADVAFVCSGRMAIKSFCLLHLLKIFSLSRRDIEFIWIPFVFLYIHCVQK